MSATKEGKVRIEARDFRTMERMRQGEAVFRLGPMVTLKGVYQPPQCPEMLAYLAAMSPDRDTVASAKEELRKWGKSFDEVCANGRIEAQRRRMEMENAPPVTIQRRKKDKRK